MEVGKYLTDRVLAVLSTCSERRMRILIISIINYIIRHGRNRTTWWSFYGLHGICPPEWRINSSSRRRVGDEGNWLQAAYRCCGCC